MAIDQCVQRPLKRIGVEFAVDADPAHDVVQVPSLFPLLENPHARLGVRAGLRDFAAAIRQLARRWSRSRLQSGDVALGPRAHAQGFQLVRAQSDRRAAHLAGPPGWGDGRRDWRRAARANSGCIGVARALPGIIDQCAKFRDQFRSQLLTQCAREFRDGWMAE